MSGEIDAEKFLLEQAKKQAEELLQELRGKYLYSAKRSSAERKKDLTNLEAVLGRIKRHGGEDWSRDKKVVELRLSIKNVFLID